MKLTHTFTHNGRTRTLFKQQRYVAQLKAGALTEADFNAKPWLLRVERDGKNTVTTLSHLARQAETDARDQLNGRIRNPTLFKAYEAAHDARKGVTVGALAREWIAANCPHSKTDARSDHQADRIQLTLNRALPFWDTRPWASVTPQLMGDFLLDRARHVRPGANYTGRRSADLQLTALSSLGKWAMREGKSTTNPFAIRERYQKAGLVKHCHEKCPENDEQFHAILEWLFTHRNNTTTNRHPAAEMDTNERLSGGYLAMQALTGLRPGEPLHLKRVPEATEFPGRNAVPGVVYPMADGTRRMRVARLKNGQNPSVLVHPALANFKAAWESWLATHLPAATSLFPVTQDIVRDCLKRACAASKLPTYTPHGMRAYYTLVQRSQGYDDLEIATHLGQTTNGALIRSTYGAPGDEVGGKQFDWLPKTGAPAWELLTPTHPTNILTVDFTAVNPPQAQTK